MFLQARRHFSADTRGKFDNAVRGAFIWQYGSRPVLDTSVNLLPSQSPAPEQGQASQLCAAAAPQGAGGVGSLTADTTAANTAAAAAPPQGAGDAGSPAADTAADAAATAANAQLSQLLAKLRLQANMAGSGRAYARPGEVFSAPDLAAIKTGVSRNHCPAHVEHMKVQDGRCNCAFVC